MFQVWYSTEIFADYIIDNTILRNYDTSKLKLMESDANNSEGFHRMPDHIKKILYLDAPDLIVEYNGEPIFTIEISREAGTGHNAFQRFGRIVASVENNVPAFYIYPKAVQIRRESAGGTVKWDELNPNVYHSLEQVMRIHMVPALLFYYPSNYPNNTAVFPNKGLIDDAYYLGCPDAQDEEMQSLFEIINIVVERVIRPSDAVGMLINERLIQERRNFMAQEYAASNNPERLYSPLSATVIIDTNKLINYLRNYGYDAEYSLLSKRCETAIYQIDAKFRGDPYPGALATLDYLSCRTGSTFEDRDRNLVLCWGKVEETEDSINIISSKGTSIEDMISKIRIVKNRANKCLLGNTYEDLEGNQIPRYYMQVRYGCTYTKQKEIRGYAYLADAILFQDGALWREA